jgi:hypothetical protein
MNPTSTGALFWPYRLPPFLRGFTLALPSRILYLQLFGSFAFSAPLLISAIDFLNTIPHYVDTY